MLAAQSGQLLNITALSKTTGLAKQTIERYLFILENTYVIKLLPPFSLNPKVEVAKAHKIFFYDTGLLQMLWLDNVVGKNVGNIFETSIFVELVKKYGLSKIKFWRNKNQNEIDFIIEDKNSILPIEVKESFHNFRKSSINLFLHKYKIDKYKVVGLKGNKTDNCFYPWEM
jgi:predicted AAA+ superfamily ATPase